MVTRTERGRTSSTALPVLEDETRSTVRESQRPHLRNTARASRASLQNRGLVFAELSRYGLLGRRGADVARSRSTRDADR